MTTSNTVTIVELYSSRHVIKNRRFVLKFYRILTRIVWGKILAFNHTVDVIFDKKSRHEIFFVLKKIPSIVILPREF